VPGEALDTAYNVSLFIYPVDALTSTSIPLPASLGAVANRNLVICCSGAKYSAAPPALFMNRRMWNREFCRNGPAGSWTVLILSRQVD
jgi:hypothetical protein